MGVLLGFNALFYSVECLAFEQNHNARPHITNIVLNYSLPQLLHSSYKIVEQPHFERPVCEKPLSSKEVQTFRKITRWEWIKKSINLRDIDRAKWTECLECATYVSAIRGFLIYFLVEKIVNRIGCSHWTATRLRKCSVQISSVKLFGYFPLTSA